MGLGLDQRLKLGPRLRLGLQVELGLGLGLGLGLRLGLASGWISRLSWVCDPGRAKDTYGTEGESGLGLEEASGVEVSV